MKNVYRFNIWFKTANGKHDLDNVQVRFVVAEDEEQAELKLDDYRKKMVKDGFCDFMFACVAVEIQEVIC